MGRLHNMLANRHTTIPNELNRQHPIKRLTYLIFPLNIYGHPTFAMRAGAILQKAMIPFGVEGGTRSRAAERIITYNTARHHTYDLMSFMTTSAHTVVNKAEKKER